MTIPEILSNLKTELADLETRRQRLVADIERGIATIKAMPLNEIVEHTERLEKLEGYLKEFKTSEADS